MKKLSLLLTFILSFFICVSSFKAGCVDSSSEEFIKKYYHTNPSQFGLNWVASTEEFKDFSDRNVTIEIYDQSSTKDVVADKDTIFIYKKVSTTNEWTLLLCTNGDISRTYWDEEIDEKGEMYDASAPIFVDSCDYISPGGVNLTTNPVSEIYVSLRNLSDSGKHVIGDIWGLGKNKENLEGLVHGTVGDHFKDCLNDIRFTSITKSNSEYNLEPRVISYMVEPIKDDVKKAIEEEKLTEWDFCDKKGVLKSMQIVNRALFIAKIVVPILLIVFGIIELSKALISSDDNAIKSSVNSLIKKIIIGLIVFFVPTIVKAIFNQIDDYTSLSNNGCYVCLFDTNDNECENLIANSNDE